jgi:pimeloyl-ACP methyl ester carboxylesterase
MGNTIDTIMFPKPSPPTYQHEEGTSLYTTTKDGRKIAYIIATPAAQPRKVPVAILYAHGNAEDLGTVAYQIKHYSSEMKVTIYAMDYAGYGMSEGQPSEQNTYLDISAMLQVVEEKFTRNNIVLWGRSLGSGPTCYLAHHAANVENKPFAGVILLSPFLSAFRVVAPGFMIKASIPLDKFKNYERMKDGGFKCRVFVLHGKQDEVIHCSHGEILAEAIPSEYRHPPVFIDGAHHNDVENVIRKPLTSYLNEFLQIVVGS